MSSGGGTLSRGATGGGGGAGGGSSSKASANGSSGADGVLSVTPDSPADSEWRARRGPLDAGEGGGDAWSDEDATGTRQPRRDIHPRAAVHAPRPAPIACRLFSRCVPAKGATGALCTSPKPSFSWDVLDFSLTSQRRIPAPPLTPFSPPASPSTGLQPTELYGKFTWKIENFSEISKRELRSNVFEVGSYKWCA